MRVDRESTSVEVPTVPSTALFAAATVLHVAACVGSTGIATARFGDTTAFSTAAVGGSTGIFCCGSGAAMGTMSPGASPSLLVPRAFGGRARRAVALGGIRSDPTAVASTARFAGDEALLEREEALPLDTALLLDAAGRTLDLGDGGASAAPVGLAYPSGPAASSAMPELAHPTSGGEERDYVRAAVAAVTNYCCFGESPSPLTFL